MFNDSMARRIFDQPIASLISRSCDARWRCPGVQWRRIASGIEPQGKVRNEFK